MFCFTLIEPLLLPYKRGLFYLYCPLFSLFALFMDSLLFHHMYDGITGIKEQYSCVELFVYDGNGKCAPFIYYLFTYSTC